MNIISRDNHTLVELYIRYLTENRILVLILLICEPFYEILMLGILK
jgi:hypothetical protein